MSDDAPLTPRPDPPRRGSASAGSGTGVAPALRIARPDPGGIYRQRRTARQTQVDTARRREGRLANARLALFASSLVAIWQLHGAVPDGLLVVLPAAGFFGLVAAHARTRRALERAERAVAFYEEGLARLEYRFAGMGDPGERWEEEDHPYATHLDLFGHGSLFEWMSRARTDGGRGTLARWLLAPADPETVADRQAAARDLAGRLDLREDLGTLDARVSGAFASRELVEWATAPPRLRSDVARRLALGVGAATLAAACAAPWVGPSPLAWLLVLAFIVWWRMRREVAAVISAVEKPAAALGLVRDVLARLEREPFEAPLLCRLRDRLAGHDPGASRSLDRLLRRVDALDWRRNEIFLPLSTLVLWGTQWAFAIERWRARHGTDIEAWIRIVGEIEALVDLGSFTFEHPDFVFPEVRTGEPRFLAADLAHPLLRACTPNDVGLGGECRLMVVTGSNMSGKSTLLRTVGVSAVLAQCGAPVRARSLVMSPLSPGASIRTLDSLQDGASRFYAEVRAIKRALDAAERRPPGLFLLDELLHGTNSEDRRIGAEAIARAFLARKALGIITTHDLALAAIADDLAPRAANAHFEFRIDDDRLVFDYRLRPGIVRGGNALAIMRAVGLDV